MEGTVTLKEPFKEPSSALPPAECGWRWRSIEGSQ